MMKTAISGLLLTLICFPSCIFQNNPLGLNQPPTIQSYAPQAIGISLVVPDSCVFSITAMDPDGDDLAYSFTTGDSVLGGDDSVMFRSVRAGEYVIRGEARDGTTEAFHEWLVTVTEQNNEKPSIWWFSPDQLHVSCAVGQTLEFHFKANDDREESLKYMYLLDGTLLHSGSPDLINRFLEPGDFVLEGVAWDGQYGDTTSWNLSVVGSPDTIAPAAISDLSGGPGDGDGTISLEWTAPGDDGSEGKAESYVVKTSVYPIVTEDDWIEAEGKPGEPAPALAGSKECMRIRNLVSASYVYVSMRAVDDFFNISPLGNCIRILVRGIDIGGQAINATTGGPAQGITIFAGVTADTTGVDGEYLLRNVPSYTMTVYARDENISAQLGDYFDCVYTIGAITQFIEMTFYMIPASPLVNAVQPDLDYLGRFLVFFKALTKTNGDGGRPTVYQGWNHWPLTVYNPPETRQGVDLQAACSRSLTDWEQSAGADFFVEVASPEGADVEVRYDTVATDRHHVETSVLNPDRTPAKKVIWVYTKNTELPLVEFADLIFTHELGHVIGLDHSRNTGHLMVGLTTPQVWHPTTDEVRVVQVIYHVPTLFDYRLIIEN